VSGTVSNNFAANANGIQISGDGLTIAVGANNDGVSDGATYIFRKVAGIWSLEVKLVGTGGAFGRQGNSVALSYNGNTLAVGGSNDSGAFGAVWIFTRTGTTWTQNGSKLITAGQQLGSSQFGTSVALSIDGNTLAIGATQDNFGYGAVYIWTRTNGVWAQQGPKLVPIGGQGPGLFGNSVAFSGDGNILFVMANIDNGSTGAVFVFDRKDGVWTQRGNKLVMNLPLANFLLTGVRVNTNGCTVLVSAPTDGGAGANSGALFKFSWDGVAWTSSKILNQDPSVAITNWGRGMALSGDGATLLVGSTGVSTTGGAYVYI
jgi:hypothetical protein